MAKSTRSSGSRKTPASKSRSVKRAARPRSATKPMPAPKPLLDPLDEHLTLPATFPVTVESNTLANEHEPRVPIKEWTMWGSIRQLIGGWAK